MIIQRYHSKGKNKHMIWFTLLSITFVQDFTIWSWTSLPCFAWLFSHSQTSYNSIENLPMIVVSDLGFESTVSSSIRLRVTCLESEFRAESLIWNCWSFRTGLYMRIFHLSWSCLSSVFSMDSAYKCLRISCLLWLISLFVSSTLRVFILTCLNKAWVFFLRIL